jgi:hypothetical protein
MEPRVEDLRIRTPTPKENDDESDYYGGDGVSPTDFESPAHVVHLGTPKGGAVGQPAMKLWLGVFGALCLTVGLSQEFSALIVFGLICIMCTFRP